jgi:hypothetical protein
MNFIDLSKAIMAEMVHLGGKFKNEEEKTNKVAMKDFKL